MGLRGPGAKPVQKTAEAPARRRRKPWLKAGLSRAERVISYVQSLKLTSGRHAGKPFKLRDWQKDAIQRIYGPTRNRRRIVRTALLSMARKNGKTQLAAALALCHLAGPESEPRGEVYSAAADRNQAARIFRELEAFILADPELAARINVQRFAKKLEVLAGDGIGSTYEAMSSDARKAHSLSPSFVIADELAQWHGRELYDNLTTGTGARAEPLTIVISTQSADPNHIMSELVRYAEQVNDGTIEDPTFVGIVYTVPPDADPFDEKNWLLANPALNDFLSLEQMRTAAERAQRMPSAESAFRNLHLNQQVAAEDRFLNARDWGACVAPIDPHPLRGRKCWAGLDLASTTDLASLQLIFPDTDVTTVLSYFWCPKDRLRERSERVPYDIWANEGEIEATPGAAIDKRYIVRRLAQITSAYDLQGVAFDRWRIEDLKMLLSEEGIAVPLMPWGQGFKDMGPAVDELETLVIAHKLKTNSKVLTWNARNAVVVRDPTGARKIAKDRSTEKVDGLVALAMAIGLHRREPPKRGVGLHSLLIVG